VNERSSPTTRAADLIASDDNRFRDGDPYLSVLMRPHPAERRPEPSSPSSGALALLISLSHIFRGSVRWDGDGRVEGLLLQETSVLGAHRLCAQFEGKYSH
jgi:hypothetical protein